MYDLSSDYSLLTIFSPTLTAYRLALLIRAVVWSSIVGAWSSIAEAIFSKDISQLLVRGSMGKWSRWVICSYSALAAEMKLRSCSLVELLLAAFQTPIR